MTTDPISISLPAVRVVTLDNYYESIHDPLAKTFFSDLTILRAKGYGPDYPKYFLPFDLVDFIARQHLFCIEKQGKLEVIGGIRHITKRRCDQYGLPLPLYRITKESQSEPHLQFFSNLIQDVENRKKDLLYSSGFTINKTARTDRSLSKLISDLIAGLTYLDFHEFECGASVGGAAMRFKTQRIFSQWGYSPFEWNGTVLPPINKKVGNENEQVLLISLKEVSDYSKECYEKYKNLLEGRLLIQAKEITQPEVLPILAQKAA